MKTALFSIIIGTSIITGTFGCTDDLRDIRPLPAGKKTPTLALQKRHLATHADFDRMEMSLAASPDPTNLDRVYDQLEKVADDPTRIRVRRAVSGMMAKTGNSGLAAAQRILESLKPSDSPESKADALYLKILVNKTGFLEDGVLPTIDKSNRERAFVLLGSAKTFIKSFPDYQGPYGATARDIATMATQIEQAMAPAVQRKGAAGTAINE